MGKKISVLISIISLLVCSIANLAYAEKNNTVNNAIIPTSNEAVKDAVSGYEPDAVTDKQFVTYRMNNKLPKQLSQAIIQKRQMIFKPIGKNILKDVEKFIFHDFDRAEDCRIAKITESLPIKEVTAAEEPKFLSPQEAKKDVNFLFDYLKYGYAGYQYCGGDKTLIPIRDRMIHALPSVTNENNLIPLNRYRGILIQYLKPVIQDCHFTIDNTNFARFYSYRFYYYSEKVIFDKDESGYYTLRAENKYYLDKVNGEIPDKYMKETIAPNGRFAYVIGISSKNKISDTKIQIILSRAGKTWQKILTLNPAKTNYIEEDDKTTGYRRYKDGGITVIENRRLTRLNHNDLELKKLVSDASSLKKEKTFIFDIRYNAGGSDGYVTGWLRNYIGEPIYGYSAINATLRSNTVYNSTEIKEKESYEAYLKEGELPGWYDIGYGEFTPTASDNLIFVLTDPWVASSGESYVSYLREIENTILVGLNTAGMRTIGNARGICLPYSRTYLYCGISLFLPSDLSEFEGRGYQPDLWVEPSLCKERVIKFIKYYGLSK